jgi:hypothetical protein
LCGKLADRPEATVESISSGWGIAAAAQARLSGDVSRPLATLLRTDEAAPTPEQMKQLKEMRPGPGGPDQGQPPNGLRVGAGV